MDDGAPALHAATDLQPGDAPTEEQQRAPEAMNESELENVEGSAGEYNDNGAIIEIDTTPDNNERYVYIAPTHARIRANTDQRPLSQDPFHIAFSLRLPIALNIVNRIAIFRSTRHTNNHPCKIICTYCVRFLTRNISHTIFSHTYPYYGTQLICYAHG